MAVTQGQMFELTKLITAETTDASLIKIVKTLQAVINEQGLWGGPKTGKANTLQVMTNVMILRELMTLNEKLSALLPHNIEVAEPRAEPRASEDMEELRNAVAKDAEKPPEPTKEELVQGVFDHYFNKATSTEISGYLKKKYPKISHGDPTKWVGPVLGNLRQKGTLDYEEVKKANNLTMRLWHTVKPKKNK